MSGPWEKFAAQDAAPAVEGEGPWTKFQSPAPATPPGVPLSRTDKVLKGVRDPIDAGAQLLTNLLPDSVVRAGNKLNNFIADKTGLVGRLDEGGIGDLVAGGAGASGVDKMVRDAEAKYQARRAAGGESGFDGYRTIGNVVSPANLAVASRLPVAASLAGRIGVGALGGAASGALTPVAEGDFWNEKAKQAGAGALVGGAIPGVAGALGRIVSPNASKNLSLQLLRKEGVNPTVGQALGGRLNTVEEKLQSLPIVGDMVSKARVSANGQFERAAHNRALKPLGMELPEGLTGRDAVTFTENTLRQRYDDVLDSIGAIPSDRQFAGNINSLRQKVNGMLMPAAEKDKFNGALSEMLESFDQRGVITSDAYKRLESALGTDARKLAGSQNIYEGKLSTAVKQLQAELRDMLERQAGDKAGDLKAVNAGWANFKRVQGAAGKIGAEDGKFTPAQFLNSVRGLDKSKDKAAFARGSALGQDLGDAGKTVLGNKVPNSGTTDRALLNATLLGGAAAINPAAAGGALLGAGLYTSPAQRALVAAISARPASAQQAAELLRKSAPYTLGASGQLGLGLLGQE